MRALLILIGESAFGFLGAQLDRVSGLLYTNGRYYDPVTGRYLTPNHGQANPYAPVQGPGVWLLLPLIGIVVAWKGRKSGVGRVFVLVCVMGIGIMLVGCGETPPTPGPTPPTLPQPPNTPTNTPTSTPTTAPTGTPTGTPTNVPLPPTNTPSPTPSPTPCPTPSDTPTPFPTPPESEVSELARMIWNEQRSQGEAAMEAAAWVARNRRDAPRWPDTLIGVLSAPNQFQGYPGTLPNEDDANWIASQRIARYVLTGDPINDPTGGAEYFGNGPGVEAAMRAWDAIEPDFEWGTIEGTNFHYSNEDYTRQLPTPTPSP